MKTCLHYCCLFIEVSVLAWLVVLGVVETMPERKLFQSENGDELSFRINEDARTISSISYGQVYCSTNEGAYIREKLPLTFKMTQLTNQVLRLRLPCPISGFEIYFNIDAKSELRESLNLVDVTLGGRPIALENSNWTNEKNRYICYLYHPVSALNGHMQEAVVAWIALVVLLGILLVFILRKNFVGKLSEP